MAFVVGVILDHLHGQTKEMTDFSLYLSLSPTYMTFQSPLLFLTSRPAEMSLRS